MIRCGIPCSKMDPARRSVLLKLSSARCSSVRFNQQTSAQSDELFDSTPQTETATMPRQMGGGGVNRAFKSMDFYLLKNKNAVRQDIKESLARIEEEGSEARAFRVIKSCGGSWFDVGRDTKNNVLTRFMDSYLAKNKISPTIGNRLLLSYTENKKDFDSKILLKSFLDAGVRPNNETYCAIIQLEIARGNFQSGLDVYKFCQDQNLHLTPSAILSLITGSVARKRSDLTSEFELAFDSKFKDLEGSDMLKSLAVHLGYAESGSLEELGGFMEKYGSGTSTESKTELLKAFCFLYKALAERQSVDSVAQCKAFLEQIKPNITPAMPLADKIIGVTSAHLYSNQLVETSLELKKSIPHGSVKLWSRVSDLLLVSSVIVNNKDPVVMLASKLRGFKDAQVLETPLITLIHQALREEGMISEVATIMSSFLENPEVEPKPHFYFPFFIKGPVNSLPSVAHVKAFCECLEQEPEKHFKFTAETLANILKTQPVVFEHLIGMQKELRAYPRFNCIMVELLVMRGRYVEAAKICESLSGLPEVLALKLSDSLIIEVSNGDYRVAEFGKIFGKCYHSLSGEKRQVVMEKLLARLKDGSYNRGNLNGLHHFFHCLSQEKCFVDNTPILYKLKQNSFNLVDGAYQKLFSPDAFLQQGVFTRNVLELSDDERREMLQKLTSDDAMDLPLNQKTDKIIILEASLGNYGPLETYLADIGNSEESQQENRRTLLVSDGRTDTLLEILFKAEKTELAMEVLKHSKRLSHDIFDPHCSFFAFLKTRSQLESVQNFVVSSVGNNSLRRVAAAFARHLLESQEKDLLQDFAEKCIAEGPFVYPMYIFFNSICETESLEKCKEVFDEFHEKAGGGLLRQPMITACVRYSTNPLSKEILTEVLKTNGSKSENEKSAGDVLLAYLQAGKVDKAKSFAKNRLVAMQELNLQQIIAKKSPELILALTEVDGKIYSPNSNSMSIGNYVFNQMKLDWNTTFDEKSRMEHEEFCRSVVETLVKEQYPLDKLAFLRFHELANLVGVNVPVHYSRHYMSNYRYKLWSSIINGNLEGALEAIRLSYGKISAHSKQILELLDMADKDRSFNENDENFLNFIAFNRSRIEQGSPGYFVSKLTSMMTGISDYIVLDSYRALLKAFASSGLNRSHRSLLVYSTFQVKPVAPFSCSLPFYLTYNREKEDFAVFAIRNLVQQRGTNIGLLVLSTLRSMDAEKIHASAESVTKAAYMMEKELLGHLSHEEIEDKVQKFSRSSNESFSAEADAAEHDDFDSDSVPAAVTESEQLTL